MNKSISVMKNVSEICSALRNKYFGEAASSKDYKDSFVINKSIENFNGLPEMLMVESITFQDQGETKASKSINFRSDCYEKIITISKSLQLSESEVCRRILYYSLEIDNSEVVSPRDIQLSALKNKVILLKTQMENSMSILIDIMNEIALLEEEA